MPRPRAGGRRSTFAPVGATGKRNVEGRRAAETTGGAGSIGSVRIGGSDGGRRWPAADGGRVTGYERALRGLLAGHERPMIPRCASVSGRPPRPPSGPPPAHGARSRRRGQTRHPVPPRHAQGPRVAPVAGSGAGVRRLRLGAWGDGTIHRVPGPLASLTRSCTQCGRRATRHTNQLSVPLCSVLFRVFSLDRKLPAF